MVGWWVEVEEGRHAMPVTTVQSAHSSSPSPQDVIKVTTYVRKGTAALIVLANFGSVPTTVMLSFNWEMLGLAPDTSALALTAPMLRVPPQAAARHSLLQGSNRSTKIRYCAWTSPCFSLRPLLFATMHLHTSRTSYLADIYLIFQCAHYGL